METIEIPTELSPDDLKGIANKKEMIFWHKIIVEVFAQKENCFHCDNGKYIKEITPISEDSLCVRCQRTRPDK